MSVGGWNKDSVLGFSFTVTDTMQNYNLLVGIRNQATYPYRNLWLFIKTTAPDKRYLVDTVEIFLATPDGRWYGKGWGDIFTASLPYKQRVRFQAIGNYSLSVTQGMREDYLKGIVDVGLRVEKTD